MYMYMSQSCALRKIEGAQCSEPVKSRVPSIMICKIKLRFSSHPRAKVRHQVPPGFARAQPCDCIILLLFQADCMPQNKTQMKTDPADKLWLFQMIRDPRHLSIQQEHLSCASKLYAGKEK